ncbi:MAG: hypothetical protein IPN17_13230 [Deltaproteobacteria bacterium]|nr:hypothetical protein [Deltaproteobacteria bacterium]
MAVSCFNATGEPTDTRFDLAYLRRGVQGRNEGAVGRQPRRDELHGAQHAALLTGRGTRHRPDHAELLRAYRGYQYNSFARSNSVAARPSGEGA